MMMFDACEDFFHFHKTPIRLVCIVAEDTICSP